MPDIITFEEKRMPEKVFVSWSSGKDSALMLHELRKDANYEVAGLLTTVTEDYGRISMHGVRIKLLEQQARALDLPLEKVLISKTSDNDAYQKAMGSTLMRLQGAGINTVAIGDIFLGDLRQYREKKLAEIGMRAVFPLWGRKTTDLAGQFVAEGFGAVVTCVDTQVLDARFCGRDYDKQFLADLPESVDPCGENGEFHSFAWRGPIFRQPVQIHKGEIVLREERFCFCDLIPE